MTPEQRVGILRVLGQVHIADDVADEDIKGKEQFKVCIICMCCAYICMAVSGMRIRASVCVRERE